MDHRILLQLDVAVLLMLARPVVYSFYARHPAVAANFGILSSIRLFWHEAVLFKVPSSYCSGE